MFSANVNFNYLALRRFWQNSYAEGFHDYRARTDYSRCVRTILEAGRQRSFLLAKPDGSLLGFHVAKPGWDANVAARDLKSSLEQGEDAAWWYANGQLYRVFLAPYNSRYGGEPEATRNTRHRVPDRFNHGQAARRSIRKSKLRSRRARRSLPLLFRRKKRRNCSSRCNKISTSDTDHER